MRVRYVFALVISMVVVSAATAFFVAELLGADSPRAADIDSAQATATDLGADSAEANDPELEAFRAKLDAYFADLVAVYPYIEEYADPNFPEQLQKAQQMVHELTDEDLALFRDTLGEEPDFWRLPALIRSTFRPGEIGPSGGKLLSPLLGHNAQHGHSCAPGASQVTIGALKVTLQLATNVSATVNGDSVGPVVAGEGPGTVQGFASPARLTAQGFVAAAEIALNIAELSSNINTACEQLAHELLLHDETAPTVLDIDEKVDTTVEMKYVHLQLIETPAPKQSGQRIFLLAASEAGVGVVIELDCKVQIAEPATPYTWEDVTSDTTCTEEKASGGIHKVVIDLKTAGFEGAQYFEVQVKHTHAAVVHSHKNDPLSRGEFDHSHVSFDHFGIAVFDRRHVRNTNMGQ